MQVQELDDLANWFKKNVLEIQCLDDDVMDQREYEESLSCLLYTSPSPRD